MSHDRKLGSVLIACGLDETSPSPSSASATRVFIDRDLRAAILLDRGCRVELAYHDGLVSSSWRGWQVSFGPGTPLSVLASAVRAGRSSLDPEPCAEAKP
jgi:hypothetical protein